MKSEESSRLTRVAAYIRVSTDKEIQQKSFLTQAAHFHHLIYENPQWQEAGIYLDYAVSGTGREPRTGFMRMLAHCRQGKINRIITKSVSRFSRNSAELLETLQDLKKRNVSVYFENENLDTGREEDQFVISVMGAAAEQEARSISENLRWSVQKKFESGSAYFHRIYGYEIRKTSDAGGRVWPQIVIREDEAQVVRGIFQKAEQGVSCTEIARILNEKRVPAPPGSLKFSMIRQERKSGIKNMPDSLENIDSKKTPGWMMHHIIAILSNERYTGDALCQKSYTAEGTWKHSKCNHGEQMRYYIENHHPAIVSRAQFLKIERNSELKQIVEQIADSNMSEEMAAVAESGEMVKKELKVGDETEERNQGKKKIVRKKYPLTRRILCPHCGCYYNRCTNTSRETENVLWCCYSRLRQADQFRCTAPKYRTAYLERAVMWMFYERFLAENDRKEDELKDKRGDRIKKFAGENGEKYLSTLRRLAEVYRREAFLQNFEEDRLYYWCRSQMGNPEEVRENVKKLEKLEQNWKLIEKDLEARTGVLDWLVQLETAEVERLEKSRKRKPSGIETGKSTLRDHSREFYLWLCKEAVRKHLAGWVLLVIPYSQQHIRVRWFDGHDTERFFQEQEIKLLGQGLPENIQ